MDEPSVELRDFFEAVLREKDRAIEMAEGEREKAANALRIELERARTDGDERLRDHITNQIAQIRGDLVSSDKLEQERIGKALEAIQSQKMLRDEQIEGLRREIEQERISTQKAIDKSESAYEKRFESVNEFRESLSDAQAKFMPREVADTIYGELTKRINIIQTAIDTQSGKSAGVTSVLALGVAGVSVLISLLVNFL